MRLHELQVTAFGPFADTVTVDFDELGAAGLFLLTGATGAGKTSVLDAVCFGLYGDVPGDRAGARQLRSDHAPADVEPRVVLRFSVGGRTFRISRSPAWERPKRRGSGTRRIHASVVAEEHRGGSWTAVSTRLDETGQLVGELLGMTCTQFTQVALLPQGRFQAFLRASSTERHDLLQRLFRTTRFDDVERWLADQRLESRRAGTAGHDATLAVLDRFCEASVTELPTDWEPRSPTGLAALLDDGRLEAWLGAARDVVRREHAEHIEELGEADARLDQATTAAATAREQELARSRGEAASRTLRQLDDDRPGVERAQRRLDAHAAAAPVLPVARRVQTAAADLARTQQLVAMARQRAVDAPGGAFLDPEGALPLDRVRADLERRHALAESWQPREHELDRLRAAAAGAGARLEQLTGRVAELDAQESQGERRAAELSQARARVTGSPDAVVRDTAHLAEVQAGLDAARELEVVTTELVAAVEEHQVRTADALAGKERYLELRERRVSGMAAELASGLAAGCSCPVCGSVDHPAPAPSGDRVARADEDAARVAQESAEVLRQAAGEAVAGHRSRAAALARVAGDDGVASWERRLHEAEVALQQSTARAEQLTALDRDLADTAERRAGLGADLATARAELTAASAQVSDLTGRADALADELRRLLAATAEGVPPEAGAASLSVAALVGRLARRRRLVDDLLEAQRSAAAAAAAHDQARAAASESVRAAGFDDVEACLSAVLDEPHARSATAAVQAWHDARRDAEQTAQEPAVVRALAADPPDVAAHDAATRRLRDVRDLHLAAARACHARAGRLGVLHEQLCVRADAWLPVHRQHLAVAALASLAEGTSTDNALKMRLSGYVLAERLRQVVAAANVRLASMSDQRFSLEQADERGAGERRGGLSLRVRDDWSGTVRDPATLSGGESFVVSLALALGLADTVTHEAGGVAVETLFVDEGFGALDSDTLDAVMDVLDALRDGGRVVGIVSHVAELRSRVTAQLEVCRSTTRSGSTVRPVVHPG